MKVVNILLYSVFPILMFIATTILWYIGYYVPDYFAKQVWQWMAFCTVIGCIFSSSHNIMEYIKYLTTAADEEK